eukprot:5961357-Pyramimonas_sp.AAC.1
MSLAGSCAARCPSLSLRLTLHRLARARWTAPRSAEGCSSAVQCELPGRSQASPDADPNIVRASSPPSPKCIATP